MTKQLEALKQRIQNAKDGSELDFLLDQYARLCYHTEKLNQDAQKLRIQKQDLARFIIYQGFLLSIRDYLLGKGAPSRQALKWFSQQPAAYNLSLLESMMNLSIADSDERLARLEKLEEMSK